MKSVEIEYELLLQIKERLGGLKSLDMSDFIIDANLITKKKRSFLFSSKFCADRFAHIVIGLPKINWRPTFVLIFYSIGAQVQ